MMLYFVTLMALIATMAFRSTPPQIYKLAIPDMRQSSKYGLPLKLIWKDAQTLTASFSKSGRDRDVRIFEYLVTFKPGVSGSSAIVSNTFDISYTQYTGSIELPFNLADRSEFQKASPIVDASGKNMLIAAVVNEKPIGPQVNVQEGPLRNHQVWLAQLPDGSNLRPVFYSKGAFRYTWSAHSKYIIASGDCYGGDLASGMYSIEVSSLKVTKLQEEYHGGCEGGTDFEVSPSERFIFISGRPGEVVASMDGRWRMQACADGAYARSMSWSSDGRYLFLACNGKQSDRLERFDTQTRSRAILIDGAAVQFRATQLSVSPDLKRVAFQSGTSTYGINNTNGIWMIDFT